MTDVYRVIDVEDRRDSHFHPSPHWQVLTENDEGFRFAHIFPDSIFIIRAGEYGIPEDDIETLLDVVLHEPYIPDPTHPRHFADDPAAKAGHVVRAMLTKDRAKPGTDVPAWLYNAKSTQQAREAHLIRVEHCKQNIRHIPTEPGDLLDVIRVAHNPKPGAVAGITAEVEKQRKMLHGSALKLAAQGGSRRRVPANHPFAEFLEP
jgi:hypothetical protein